MTSNVFEDQGIQFKVISPEMYGDVLDFLWENFFPEEPLFRSMGITRGPLVDKYLFPEVFRQNCSIAALDSTGNILAVRVGIIKNKSSWNAWFQDKMFAAFPYRLFSNFLSPFVQKVPVLLKLQKTIEFNVWKKFDGWNCQSVFEVISQCYSLFLTLLIISLCRDWRSALPGATVSEVLAPRL